MKNKHTLWSKIFENCRMTKLFCFNEITNYLVEFVCVIFLHLIICLSRNLSVYKMPPRKKILCGLGWPGQTWDLLMLIFWSPVTLYFDWKTQSDKIHIQVSLVRKGWVLLSTNESSGLYAVDQLGVFKVPSWFSLTWYLGREFCWILSSSILMTQCAVRVSQLSFIFNTEKKIFPLQLWKFEVNIVSNKKFINVSFYPTVLSILSQYWCMQLLNLNWEY